MIICPECCEEVDRRNIVGHLEEVHTGGMPMDEIKLKCSDCAFRVTKDRIEHLISHCTRTNHQSRPSLDWQHFVELEEERVQEIVRLGCNILRGASKLSFTSGDLEWTKNDTVVEQLGSQRFSPISISDQRKRGFEGNETLFKVPAAKKRAAKNRKKHAEPELSVIKMEVPVEDETRSDGEPVEPKKKVLKSKGAKTAVCDECKETVASQPWKQIQHILGHKAFEEIRLFSCDHCDHLGRRKGGMYTHGTRMHNIRGGFSQKPIDKTLAKDIRKEVMRSFPERDWPTILQDGIPGLAIEPEPMTEEEATPTTEDESQVEKTSKVKMVACQVCNANVKLNPCSKVQHILGHDGFGAKLYNCHNCDYFTNRKETVRRHTSKKHKDIEGYSQREVGREEGREITAELLQSFPGDDWTRTLRSGIPSLASLKAPTEQLSDQQETEEKATCQVCEAEVEREVKGQVEHVLGHEKLSKTKLFTCHHCDHFAQLRREISDHCQLEHEDPAGFSENKVSGQLKTRIMAELMQSFPDEDWVEKLQNAIPSEAEDLQVIE